MRPGQLDQRITFRRLVRTADGAGGFTAEAADIATNPTVWAHVRAPRGSERFDEERTAAFQVAVFVIRNRSDIDETMHIVWQGATWNIRAVVRRGPREMYLDIEAERGVAP